MLVVIASSVDCAVQIQDKPDVEYEYALNFELLKCGAQFRGEWNRKSKKHLTNLIDRGTS